MTTAADLTARGYRKVCYGSPWRILNENGKGPVRVPLVEYWGHPDTGDFVRVYRGPDAATAFRGHWKFHPLAAWFRWHFVK